MKPREPAPMSRKSAPPSAKPWEAALLLTVPREAALLLTVPREAALIFKDLGNVVQVCSESALHNVDLC